MTLQDIYIYPVKSLGGIGLHEALTEEKGLKYDRRWMLVDNERNFLTQRTIPELALLKAIPEIDGLRIINKNKPDDELFIPYGTASENELSVQIWGDVVLSKEVSIEASHWFTNAIGKSCRMVVMPEKVRRPVDPTYAVNKESVSFADGMPYLLIGQSSLDDLNSKLDAPLPMDRFRPNLVFSGAEPFAEDTWKTIRIGECIFQIVKPCARCVITTINQETAEQGKEPLRTLSKFRKTDTKVMFGQNMVLLEGNRIRVGDEVIPVE